MFRSRLARDNNIVSPPNSTGLAHYSLQHFIPFPQVDYRMILYEPMHGLARLLALVIQTIQSAVQDMSAVCSRKIADLLRRYRWSETSGFNPKAAKQFFGQGIDSLLGQCLQSAEEELQFVFRTHSGEYESFVNSATGAVKCVREYWTYIYNKTPSNDDFKALCAARDQIESFLWSLQYQIPPAPHYMLNHFIDGVKFFSPIPPYDWINESNEAFHTVLRNLLASTPKLRQKRDNELYDTYDLAVRHSQTLHHCRLREPMLK